MDLKDQEQVALHRWAVIAAAAGERPAAAERGVLVRQIAARAHVHPDGSSRRYSRGTIDQWLRAWRAGGLEALRPSPRAGTGAVRAHPELFAEAAALRLELPGRSAAQIAPILYHRHGAAVAGRTIRAQLRRAGLHRQALTAEPKAYGRYETGRPNERWITHGPTNTSWITLRVAASTRRWPVKIRSATIGRSASDRAAKLWSTRSRFVPSSGGSGKPRRSHASPSSRCVCTARPATTFPTS